jgi:hypothetical protein
VANAWGDSGSINNGSAEVSTARDGKQGVTQIRRHDVRHGRRLVVKGE